MSSLNIYNQISKKIIENDNFLNDYITIISFANLKYSKALPESMLKRLLESAAIFACSDRDEIKLLSLNIVSKVLEYPSNELFKAAAEFLLIRLGNFPMLKMSVEKYNHKDYFNIFSCGKCISNMPIALKTEAIMKLSMNQVIIENKTEYLTDFQSRVMDYLNQEKSISISAPTSSGKSFILMNYIKSFLKNKNKALIIYIVPTRALISQVQRDIRSILDKNSTNGVELFTSSWQLRRKSEEMNKIVFILTPERLQTIEGHADEFFKADLLILDEAHKIEDGSRGIILEDSVQQIIEWNPKAQVVFLSPFTQNPEKLAKIFNLPDVIPLKTNISPVSQNIFFVNIDKTKASILLYSKELNKNIPLYDIDTEIKLPESYIRKVWLAIKLLKSGPTIIYCNGPSECRKTADAIRKEISMENMAKDVQEIKMFLARYIHKDYYLIDYIGRGVGYHYGNMPPMIRMVIERLFSGGFINAICCTSTLIEGMNFPAKNIVIYKPKSGPRKPMKDITFWNLSGRAGRLMKDFCGNIYCIDINSWGESYTPQLNEGGHLIGSSMEDVIIKKEKAVMENLRSYANSRKKDNEDVEAAVTRFIITEVQKGNKEFCSRLLERESSISQNSLDDIISLVKEISSNIEIPANIIIKNKMIDPRLQNELYLKLKKLETLTLPCHPTSSEFYDRLEKIISIVDNVFKRGYSTKYLSFLANIWVKEKTLGEIITGQINYFNNKTGEAVDKDQINKIIDNIIRDIGDKLQFEICRDIGCYIDILDYVLQEKGVRTSFDDLGYFIEMGAYKKTTLTLLNNGLPRTIALIISRRLPDEIDEFEECKKYMKNNHHELVKEIPCLIIDNIVNN